MSTENEYTPTTGDVKFDYAHSGTGTHSLKALDRRSEQFDRWLAARDAEVAANALEDAAVIAETGDGAEAESWAGWLHRRAAALRASTGGDPSGYIQIEEHMLSEEGWPSR